MAKKETRSLKNYHIAFAIGSLLLLITTVWCFTQDYNDRAYMPWQKEYQTLEQERLAAEQEAVKKGLEQIGGYAELETKRDAAQAQVDGQEERIQQAEEEIRKAKGDYQLLEREFNFAGADISVVTYQFTAEQIGLEQFLEVQRRHRDLFNKLQAQKAKIEDFQKQIAEIYAPLKEAERAYNEFVAKYEVLELSLRKAKGKPILNLVKDLPGVDFVQPRWNLDDQKILPNLPVDMKFAKTQRLDRCISCHKGIANPSPMYDPLLNREIEEGRREGTAVPRVLRAHPRLDLYVSANSSHPDARFGCTICHGGRSMGGSFMRAAHTPRNAEQGHEWAEKYGWDTLDKHAPGQPLWDDPMLPIQYVEASCRKCHKGLDHIPEAPKLNRGLDLFRDQGCVNCHIGTTDPDFAWFGRVGPDLRRIGEKTNAAWLRRWIKNPWEFRPSTRMPRLFGLENRNKDKIVKPDQQEAHVLRDEAEIEAISIYLTAASKLREQAPAKAPAGDPEKGKILFETLGCLGCHATQDAPERFNLSDHGPDLSRVAGKLSPDWLFQWLKNPRDYFAETRMPNLRLSDQEAADITAHLMSHMKDSNKSAEIPPAPSWALDQLIREILKNSTPDALIAERLKKPDELVREVLKRKVVMKKDKDTGTGEWTLAQIDHVMKAMDEMGGDPTGQERVQKAFYAGQALIQHYGCFACHNIQGWTYAPLNCVSLVGEADKGIDRFDFWKVPIGQNRWEWFYTKITRPRVFDIGREEITRSLDRLKMPWFGFQRESLPTAGKTPPPHAGTAQPARADRLAYGGVGGPNNQRLLPVFNPDLEDNYPRGHGLTHSDAQALVTVLLSMTNEEIPLDMKRAAKPRELAEDMGYRVTHELNCIGCHQLGADRPLLLDDPATRGSLPLESLLTLETQQAAKNMTLTSDRDEFTLDLGAASGFLHFSRGTFLSPSTLNPLLIEKPVRITGGGPLERLNFRLLDRSSYKGKPGNWQPLKTVISRERFVSLTWRLLTANPEKAEQERTQARQQAGKIYDEYTQPKSMKYLEVGAYERLAGTAALQNLPVSAGGLTSLEIERRKKEGRYYPPVLLQVRGAYNEGKLVPHLVKVEGHQQMAPPSLAFEGGKVQPDWFYQFLHNVHPIRPGIRVRMPSFFGSGRATKAKKIYAAGRSSSVQADERGSGIDAEPYPAVSLVLPDAAQQVVEYFSAVAGESPFGFQPVPQLTEANRKLYDEGYLQLHAGDRFLNCMLCHKVGAKDPTQKEKDKWGPNLAEVKRRFKETWLRRFLSSPSSLYPWTNMPANFYKWETYNPEAPVMGVVAEYTDPSGKKFTPEEMFEDYARRMNAVTLFLMNSGEAEIGTLPPKE